MYLDVQKVTLTDDWAVAWKNDWTPNEHGCSVQRPQSTADSHGDTKGTKPPADIPAYKDSAYSLLVLPVAFLASFMTDGFIFAIGLYFVEFRDIFGSSAGLTSLVSSLSFSVECFSGDSTC